MINAASDREVVLVEDLIQSRRTDAQHCAAGLWSPSTSIAASRAAFVGPLPSATVQDAGSILAFAVFFITAGP